MLKIHHSTPLPIHEADTETLTWMIVHECNGFLALFVTAERFHSLTPVISFTKYIASLQFKMSLSKYTKSSTEGNGISTPSVKRKLSEELNSITPSKKPKFEEFRAVHSKSDISTAKKLSKK